MDVYTFKTSEIAYEVLQDQPLKHRIEGADQTIFLHDCFQINEKEAF